MSDNITDALDNLRAHQQQLDAHGDRVAVSRQALNEVIAAYGRQAEEMEALRMERDDALSRIEELESYGEMVASEFEGDCWKALRSLLIECNFDWRDADPDGVQAEQAREYISECLSEMEKDLLRFKDRATRVEALLTETAKVLKPFGGRDSLRVVVGGPELRAIRNFLAKLRHGENDDK